MNLRSPLIDFLTLSMLILLLYVIAPGAVTTAQSCVTIDTSTRIGCYSTCHVSGTAPGVATRSKVNVKSANLTLNGTWQNASDRNIKENFSPVDADEVLAKVVTLPITEWNYIEEEDRITHIGPMAQDFYQAFGLGGDDKSISTIDPAGVALVSIKALAKKQQELEALKGEVDALRRMVREIGIEMRAMKEGKNSVSGK